MYGEIVKIREIRDDDNGADIVNSLLSMGWKFISACQVGTPESMDIVYVIGATKDVIEREEARKNANPSPLKKILQDYS